MDAIIQQILLFLFFLFTVIVHSKNSCPTSYCGSNFRPIEYPFKLQTDQPPNNCQDYINLRCSMKGQTIINLPFSGEFIATYIDYYSQKISLSDPGNCLPRRLMSNFSWYPLEAFRYDYYTFYTCPIERLTYEFNAINCLSNYTNATIATTGYSEEYMEKRYGCKPIVSSMIPVRSDYNYQSTFDDLQLTWNVSGCKDCEVHGVGQSDDSKSKSAKIFGSSFFIPSAVVLATFFGIAFLLRLLKLMTGRADTNDTTTNSPTADATLAPPQTTGDTPAALPGATNGKVRSCTELVIYSESQGTSIRSSVTCSICLEEYHGKDRVKFLLQCGHCYHAECIDQWLQKNTTCPVCRTSLSNF